MKKLILGFVITILLIGGLDVPSALAASLSVTPTSGADTSVSLSITISPQFDVFYWGVYDPSGNMTDIVNVTAPSYQILNPLIGPGHPAANGTYHIILIDSSQSGWPNNCDGLSPYTGTYSSCIASAGYAGIDYPITIGGGGEPATTTPVASTNTYIFLIVGILIFLAQLFAILVIMYIIAMLIGWPIKNLMRRIKQLIRRSEYP